jgi:D-glucuronyl C5-epimerase C-terminus
LVAALLAGAGALLFSPATSFAARVLVLGKDGRASVRNDPFVRGPAFTPAPLGSDQTSLARAARSRRVDRNVRTELARLRRTHAITTGDYRRYLASFNKALATVKHLSGGRAFELEAVIQNLHAIAASGQLTSSRLPVLFLTLDRNRQWWSTGPLLGSGQRVEFSGSELVWQYYPGQGLELQELGSFGKADGLYTAGPLQYPRMRHLLAELIPLAARRAGGIAWEYYFNFDGGAPPWTSAMSQGTALEALTRAFKAFGDRSYLALARRALPVFKAPPPAGVSVRTGNGAWYLLYSFAPGATVVNGFLQSLIGLYDYAKASGDLTAAQLFNQGNAEALAEVPRYDTGAWSLYQPGQEDTLDYHELVTGFLRQLCDRVQEAVYCQTADHFDAYLKTPPALELLTHRARAGRAATIRFHLSKVSHVGIVVQRGGAAVFSTSADFGYGSEAFSVPALGSRGSYTVRLAATDLAGNFNRIEGTLQVSR